MRINGIELGIQSWCFRGFKTHEEVIRATKEIGLTCVEMCSAHVNFSDESTFDPMVRLYRDAGITINSTTSRFRNDETSARKVFEFARIAGFSTIGALPEPDSLPLLDRLCDEYGMKIGIHNHGRQIEHRFSFSWLLQDAFDKISPNIGLTLDTAWALDVMENPVEFARKFADRLYGVHIKDFVFNRDGSPVDAIIGTGNLCLKDFLGTLKEIGFQGYMSIEYDGAMNDPIPSAKECLKQLLPFADISKISLT